MTISFSFLTSNRPPRCPHKHVLLILLLFRQRLGGKDCILLLAWFDFLVASVLLNESLIIRHSHVCNIPLCILWTWPNDYCFQMAALNLKRTGNKGISFEYLTKWAGGKWLGLPLVMWNPLGWGEWNVGSGFVQFPIIVNVTDHVQIHRCYIFQQITAQTMCAGEKHELVWLRLRLLERTSNRSWKMRN